MNICPWGPSGTVTATPNPTLAPFYRVSRAFGCDQNVHVALVTRGARRSKRNLPNVTITHSYLFGFPHKVSFTFSKPLLQKLFVHPLKSTWFGLVGWCWNKGGEENTRNETSQTGVTREVLVKRRKEVKPLVPSRRRVWSQKISLARRMPIIVIFFLFRLEAHHEELNVHEEMVLLTLAVDQDETAEWIEKCGGGEIFNLRISSEQD